AGAGLLLVLGLVAAYAAGYHFLPPLVRAGLAALALGLALSRWRFGVWLHPGVTGLLLLSLPVVPTLQFYLGYPMRWLVAALASAMLRLAGYAVRPEGACLDWAGKLVALDAPCSGVRMLWAGLFLAMAL